MKKPKEGVKNRIKDIKGKVRVKNRIKKAFLGAAQVLCGFLYKKT